MTTADNDDDFGARGIERSVQVPQSPRVVTSETLLRGESQLAILHERTVYILRKTRFGKLILTK